MEKAVALHRLAPGYSMPAPPSALPDGSSTSEVPVDEATIRRFDGHIKF